MASENNFAGPLEIDPSVRERDAQIREVNDGDPVRDMDARAFVETNRTKIFGLQSRFFTELRDKLSHIGV